MSAAHQSSSLYSLHRGLLTTPCGAVSRVNICSPPPLHTGPADNHWLSAISSHFAYWASADTALFVLRALHGLDVRQGTPKYEAAGALGTPSLGSPSAAGAGGHAPGVPA